MCQNIKLYTLNVCSLSYVNFTSRKLFPEKKKKRYLTIQMVVLSQSVTIWRTVLHR